MIVKRPSNLKVLKASNYTVTLARTVTLWVLSRWSHVMPDGGLVTYTRQNLNQ
jgi:hypothetical protein